MLTGAHNNCYAMSETPVGECRCAANINGDVTLAGVVPNAHV